MNMLTTFAGEVSRRCPGGCLPENYLIVDIETSGLSFDRPREEDGRLDVIVQFGFGHVVSHELVDCGSVFIRRPAGTMSAGAARVTGITDEFLQQIGVEPDAAMPIIAEVIQANQTEGQILVGHNIIGFDAPFLVHDLARHGINVSITTDECLDTGMLFKAAKLGVRPSAVETLAEFQLRVSDSRSRTKWSLARAAEELNLKELYGVNMSHAHDAAYDCRVTHLVLEEFRTRAWL